MSPTAPKKPRQAKTPRQRAEEALAVAERRLTKSTALCTRLRKELEAADRDASEARQMRDYAAKNPALKAAEPAGGPVTSISTPSTTGADQ